MSLFAPGSLGWLIRYELRLSWRNMIGQAGGRARRLIISFSILGVIAFGFGGLGGWASRLVTPEVIASHWPSVVAIVDTALFFLTTLMLAQGLATATIVFYDRGDLDLLLTSPVKPGRLLTVRMLAMVAQGVWFFLAFLGPFILASAVLGGHWPWLAAFLVIGALGLVNTALGVAAAMGLVRLLGPRRTRTIAQVLGAFVGASIMLISQSPNLMGRSRAAYVYGKVTDWMAAGEGTSWLSWPARAALGQPVPLLVTVAVGIASFALIAWLLGLRFADNAAAAAGAAERIARTPARSNRQAAFRPGLMRAMISKELKLVSRDPTLISQVMLQVLYIVIMTFALAHGGRRGHFSFGGIFPSIAAGSMTFLVGQISAGLGWLTISAEDAPELLLVAPVTQIQVAQAKVMAVVLPVGVLMLIPAGFVGWLSPWAGFVTLVGAGAAAVAMGFIELWNQKPAKRSEFRMRRRGTGSSWVYMVEMLINLVIAAAVGMLASGSPIVMLMALIPAALAVTGVFVMKKDKWLNG